MGSSLGFQSLFAGFSQRSQSQVFTGFHRYLQIFTGFHRFSQVFTGWLPFFPLGFSNGFRWVFAMDSAGFSAGFLEACSSMWIRRKIPIGRISLENTM